jgi:hypothetical protein
MNDDFYESPPDPPDDDEESAAPARPRLTITINNTRAQDDDWGAGLDWLLGAFILFWVGVVIFLVCVAH